MSEHEKNEQPTLRDWFANNAPEMPEWFRVSATRPAPPPPPSFSDLPGHEQKRLKAIGAPRSEAFRNEVHRIQRPLREAREDWAREQQDAHYFAWRWHYADMMMAKRGEG